MSADKQAPAEKKSTDAVAQTPQEGSVSKTETSYESLRGVATGDGRIMLGRDIEVFPDKPRDDFASFGTKAFEARDRRLSGEQLALLCSPSIVPRVSSIASYKNFKNPNMLKLIEAGIVDWPQDNRQYLCLVFEMPPGKKVMSSPDDHPHLIPPERIVQAMIRPLVSVLLDLRNADIIHGGISPENMFIAGGEGSETIILGECLSSAPFLRQNAYFETVEQGLAQPSGRDPRAAKGDLYALGMSVAMISRGVNPFVKKTPRQILHEKLEAGSYSMVVEEDRVSTEISEFVRGVLQDDASQRWDLDDVARWLEGRRLNPKQPRVHIRAARPFLFKEKKYWDLRPVAQAFAESPAEAAVSIEKDQFDLWIKRNFEDKELLARMEKIWEKEKSSSRERLMAHVCMALDPYGPIRYKDVAVYPDGIGLALAETMALQKEVQNYAEIISSQFAHAWISQRYEEIPDATGMITLFEKCRNFLAQKMAAYGLERVLYILNKEAVCMSPLLLNHFVLTPGHLLMALEDIARRPDRPESVLDRHMIAFISVRDPKMIDPYLGHVISYDRGHQIIGIVRTLDAIQKRYETGPVPGVGSWIISMIEPAVKKYYDRDLVKDIMKRIEKLRDAGYMATILDLIDNDSLRQDDNRRFLMARAEHTKLAAEKENIENQLSKKHIFGVATGRQAAMLLSSVLSAISIFGYIVFYFTG